MGYRTDRGGGGSRTAWYAGRHPARVAAVVTQFALVERGGHRRFGERRIGEIMDSIEVDRV